MRSVSACGGGRGQHVRAVSRHVLRVVGCICVLMGHEAMCLQACNFVETSKCVECPECSVCVGSVECVHQWYTPTQYMVMCF